MLEWIKAVYEKFNGETKVVLVVLVVLLFSLAFVITNYPNLKEFASDVFGNKNTEGVNSLEANKSPDELLKEAQICYDSKAYMEALSIYRQDIFNENPIALCNLGYIYANGLGVEVNIAEAETFYEKSYKLGNETALKNLIALKLNDFEIYSSEDTIKSFLDLLTHGVELENLDIVRFVVSSAEDKEYSSSKADIDYCFEYLRQNTIYQLYENGIEFYYWESQGKEKFYSVPANDPVTKYIYIASGNESTANSSVLYEIYEIQKLKCKYIAILNEQFYRL